MNSEITLSYEKKGGNITLMNLSFGNDCEGISFIQKYNF